MGARIATRIAAQQADFRPVFPRAYTPSTPQGGRPTNRVRDRAFLPLAGPPWPLLPARSEAPAVRRSFEAGCVVIAEAGTDTGLWFVSAGTLTLSLTRMSGQRLIVEFLHPGDAFGEGWMVDPAPPEQPEVRTLTPCRLLVWPGWAAAEHFARDERFRAWMVGRMTARLRRSRDAVMRTLGLEAAERIELLLLDLGQTYGTAVPGGTRVDLPLSQDVLASAVGATRETVNRAIRALQSAGRVRREGQTYSVMTNA